MKNGALTKKQLLEEVRRLRREVSRLEKARETDAAAGIGKAQLRMLVEALPDVVLTLDGAGRYLKMLARRNGLLGALPEELDGKCIHDIIPRETADQCVAIIGKTIESGEGQVVEYELDVIEGHRWFEGRTSPLREPDGSISKVLWIARDVTGRKQAEERIKTALEEKELLLKEIYHRVKNNLQIIISLLKLQAGYVTDSETQELFRKSRNRIASMAIIHEILYSADNLTSVDFNRYIHTLISHLFSGYAIQPGKIRLETDIRDIFLDINTAIPCGLIINELVSSCLDRGCPDHDRGIIRISMRRPAGKGIELSFSSRGGDGPEELVGKKNPSFGRELIETLTRQLGGKLKIERNEWTTLKITFSDRLSTAFKTTPIYK
ncbi:MAG: histidine kinase dimerization/phosphoacceptor domain -containing protein [PVC group bacterium]